jgi:hypothetical protein
MLEEPWLPEVAHGIDVDLAIWWEVGHGAQHHNELIAAISKCLDKIGCLLLLFITAGGGGLLVNTIRLILSVAGYRADPCPCSLARFPLEQCKCSLLEPGQSPTSQHNMTCLNGLIDDDMTRYMPLKLPYKL